MSDKINWLRLYLTRRARPHVSLVIVSAALLQKLVWRPDRAAALSVKGYLRFAAHPRNPFFRQSRIFLQKARKPLFLRVTYAEAAAKFSTEQQNFVD